VPSAIAPERTSCRRAEIRRTAHGPTASVALVTTTTAAVDHDTAPFESLDWVLVLSAAGIWGASFLFIAIGLDAFGPGLVTLLRVGFGALTLAAFPAARRPVERSDRARVALLGFVWMAFPLTLFPLAQQWIDSSLAGMLNSAMPVMTVVVSWLVFHTPTGSRRLVGVAVGLGGILLIGVPEASTAGTSAVGVGLVLVAVTSYGVAVNIAGPLQRRYGSLPVMARALGFAFVMAVPFGVADGFDSSWEWRSLLACMVLGVAGTGFAFVFAVTLAGRVGAVRTSIVTYLIPIVAVVLGTVFRDETITALSLIGTVVILVGAWLATRVG
jgi:drug/metabolite transporter (DMT)-like permease